MLDSSSRLYKKRLVFSNSNRAERFLLYICLVRQHSAEIERDLSAEIGQELNLRSDSDGISSRNSILKLKMSLKLILIDEQSKTLEDQFVPDYSTHIHHDPPSQFLKCLHILVDSSVEEETYQQLVNSTDASNTSVSTNFCNPPLLIIDKSHLVAGLTSIARCLVVARFADPRHQWMLGYKSTCFKACSEVSFWCEFVNKELVVFVEPLELSRTVTEHFLRKLQRLLVNQRFKPACYKAGYFRRPQSCDEYTLSLHRYYSILHHQEIHSQFFTSHMPNLVDLFIHFALSYKISEKPVVRDMLLRFTALREWYQRMMNFPNLHQTYQKIFCSDVAPLLAPESLIPALDYLQIDDKTTQRADNPDDNHPGDLHKVCTERKTIEDLYARLKCFYSKPTPTEPTRLDWETLPSCLDPARGGGLPAKRADKKRQQLENLVHHTLPLIDKSGLLLVDFCAGSGHLGLLLAHLRQDLRVRIIENKEESIIRAKHSATELGILDRVSLIQCNLTEFVGDFDIGVSLHACGLATDLVLAKCREKRASAVVCPCCYGTIFSTSAITFPRSAEFRGKISPHESIMLGHSADKTERGIEQQELGEACMSLVDLDRSLLLQMVNYHTELYTMSPLTCSPKHNIIVASIPNVS